MGKPWIQADKRAAYRWLVVESVRLREKYPSFSVRVNGDRMATTGKLQPTDVSRVYRVKLTYRYGYHPKVWVVDPAIPYESAIHMYMSDNSLCLYDWREQPWEKSCRLYDTIIPWTSEWLLYYEIYKLTGKWIGRSALHVASEQVQVENQDEDATE